MSKPNPSFLIWTAKKPTHSFLGLPSFTRSARARFWLRVFTPLLPQPRVLFPPLPKCLLLSSPPRAYSVRPHQPEWPGDSKCQNVAEASPEGEGAESFWVCGSETYTKRWVMADRWQYPLKTGSVGKQVDDISLTPGTQGPQGSTIFSSLLSGSVLMNLLILSPKILIRAVW